MQARQAGICNQRIRVQRSTNLRDWEDWQTVTLGENGSQLTDTIVGNAQCFYRVIEDKPVATE